MSHIAIIDIQIRSLEALKAACERLGLQFVEGQQKYKWFGRWVGDTKLPEGFTVADMGKCDHAIRVPGADYEVGVVQQGDEYKLLWDFYRPGGLEAVLGPGGQKLVQAYAVEASKIAAERQGHSVWEESLEDGSIRLHVQVAA